LQRASASGSMCTLVHTGEQHEASLRIIAFLKRGPGATPGFRFPPPDVAIHSPSLSHNLRVCILTPSLSLPLPLPLPLSLCLDNARPQTPPPVPRILPAPRQQHSRAAHRCRHCRRRHRRRCCPLPLSEAYNARTMQRDEASTCGFHRVTQWRPGASASHLVRTPAAAL